MQGAIVAIKKLACANRVSHATTVEQRREREMKVPGNQQIGEELQEFRLYLKFAVCGRMQRRDRLQAPGPSWHLTPCGFEPLPPCVPARAPPTRQAVGWR